MNEKVFFCPNEKKNGQLITCKCLQSIRSDLFVSDARLNLQQILPTRPLWGMTPPLIIPKSD